MLNFLCNMMQIYPLSVRKDNPMNQEKPSILAVAPYEGLGELFSQNHRCQTDAQITVVVGRNFQPISSTTALIATAPASQ